MLEAENVTALAENSNTNYGLLNNGAAKLHGGSFTGRGGTSTRGIENNNSGTLTVRTIIALAENGSDTNYGLYNSSSTATADSSQFIGVDYGLYQFSGTVYLGASQLDGGASSSGMLTCTHVYDGNYSDYNCP